MAELIVENCLKIKQNELNLYVFELTAEQIHNNFVVSRRYKNREEGYQRILKETKVKNIARYLDGTRTEDYPSILPNSILIALDEIEYEKKSSILKIFDNNEDYKGLIIDGQHRSEGAYKYNSSFPLVVIGVVGLKPKYQARLFITINDTQKSLPKSLYRDLFSLIGDEEITEELLNGEGLEVDIKAVEIAKELNSDVNASLYKMIDLTGEKQQGYISLSEFIRGIKPFINYDNGKFKEYSFKQQMKIIDNYFHAIKRVFTDEWEKDKKPLFKTTIFGGLFKSLEDIWDIVIRDYHNFKIENIQKVLLASEIDSLENLAINMGGGFKAQENYHKKFIKLLKDKLKTDGQVNIEL